MKMIQLWYIDIEDKPYFFGEAGYPMYLFKTRKDARRYKKEEDLEPSWKIKKAKMVLK